jgi:hypothetical protein
MPYYYDTPDLLYDGAATYDDGPPQPQQKGKRMAKVKLGLSTLDPNEVVELANQIITSMTGNANFATPNPTLAAVRTQKDATTASITGYDTAKEAASAALVTRDNNVTVLKNLLTQLGLYVENTSAGDAAKIESAGMSVRATSAPVGPMGQVMDLVLSPGDFEATLDAVWNPVRGALSYEVQISPDPPTPTSWAAKMTAGKSSATIEELTSGARMWVRVRAVGADNKPGPWSDPAVKTVP